MSLTTGEDWMRPRYKIRSKHLMGGVRYLALFNKTPTSPGSYISRSFPTYREALEWLRKKRKKIGKIRPDNSYNDLERKDH